MPSRYVTTPIYYVNAEPHIGHAYTNLASDTIARFYRQCGDDVFFLTGTDEHGEKIQQKARERDMTPEELVDDVVVTFQQLWDDLRISHDDFIRTTDQRHVDAVQQMFNQLRDQGDIYKDVYEGAYCIPCETHWSESQLNDNETCPQCGRDIEYREESSYFFRITEYLDDLQDHLDDHPEFIRPSHRMNEVDEIINNNEGDLSISRTRFDWGIPVPGDEEHVIYVWFDALINYLSGIGYPDDEYNKWWPADVHVIGKDILRFHGMIWPCMLMAADVELPNHIDAHGWWTLKGEKISKSKGNTVDPRELAETYGRDELRFFLLRQIPFGEDGTMSDEAMVETINGNLANDLGNLVNRVLNMIEQYRDGTLPTPTSNNPGGKLDEQASEARSAYCEQMSNMRFDRALKAVFEFVTHTNKWLQNAAPWKISDDPDRREELDTVLYHSAEALNEIGYLLNAAMPETAEAIWQRLDHTPEHDLTDREWGELQGGEAISKGSPLFPRIETSPS